MSKKLLVVGSANLDLVFESPSLPLPGQTLIGTNFRMQPGGKGANQAVAAGRLGALVEYVGCVGDDSNAEILRQSLRGAGVGLAYMEQVEGTPTGVAGILVDENAQNSIVVVPGANGNVTPQQVSRAIIEVSPDVVLAQLEIPLDAVLACAGPALFILNPAPACPLPSELLSRVSILTPNETEAEFLTGITVSDEGSAKRACAVLHDQGVATVIITLGARGCYVSSPEFEGLVPGISVDAVDTTAAGDAFNGALACFMAEGLELMEAVRGATEVAALSTTRSGAQASMPTRGEWQAFRSSR